MCHNAYIIAHAEKKRTITITLVEEDIAKLKYEIVYIRERQKTEKLTLNRLVQMCRRADVSRFEVSCTLVRNSPPKQGTWVWPT